MQIPANYSKTGELLSALRKPLCELDLPPLCDKINAQRFPHRGADGVADAIIANAIAKRPSVSVLWIGPPQAMPGVPVYFFIQSLRTGRLRKALAASSPGNDSLFGSHFNFRPSSMAMLPMCIAVLSRWSASAV